MNYRHLYHAGNFADVVKHIVLIALLDTLHQKPTPFCFLDTHAGLGLYALTDDAAQKGKEYLTGIEKILSNKNEILNSTIKHYCKIVQNQNTSDGFNNIYPGSPMIALEMLRPQDRMLLCELHTEDHDILKKNIGKHPQVFVHHTDGYQGIKAFLPPKENRGLVLIDPPFEDQNEFDQIAGTITHVKKRWQSGQVMIWYPIKNRHRVEKFYRKINQLSIPQLCLEFCLTNPAELNKLSVCGILILNPPWKLADTLKQSILPELSKLLEATWEIK